MANFQMDQIKESRKVHKAHKHADNGAQQTAYWVADLRSSAVALALLGPAPGVGIGADMFALIVEC